MSRPPAVPRVRILFPFSGNGRNIDLIRSICEACQERYRWDLEVTFEGDPEAFLHLQRTCPSQGVMAFPISSFRGGVLHDLGVPTLALLIEDGPLPVVMPDDEAVGRMAARHLQRPGWTRMAVYERDTSWWQARCRGWRAEAPDAPVVPFPGDEGAGVAWMTGLPDGAALFASHDHVALRLARLGHQVGRQVGRDLRILGVDDQMDCLMTTPAISSIALPMRALGRLAVSTMAALMAGRPVPPRQMVAPLGVMVRGSSDPLSQVAPWIRDLALDLRALVATGRRPDLRRLIDAQGRHRSTVNRAWRDAMGCSVMDYVQDVRCELARIRLADGAGDPEAVARSLGLASARSLLRLLADR